MLARALVLTSSRSTRDWLLAASARKAVLFVRVSLRRSVCGPRTGYCTILALSQMDQELRINANNFQ